MESDAPIIRYIETTGRCNMHCPVCVDKIRNFDMRDSDFEQIVKINSHLLNGQALWLDFNGEPLLDPQLIRRIYMLYCCGAKPLFSTNGLLLTETMARNLAEAHPAMVSVSIMTLDREQYREYHGVDCFDIVLGNLLSCKKVFDQMGVNIPVQAVKLDLGHAEENEAFIRFFHSYGIDVACHRFTNRTGDVSLDLSKSKPLSPHGKCVGRRQNVIVLANCNVVLCCCDYLGRASIGNLRDYEYSVERLLSRSPAYKEFAYNQEHNIFSGICEKCGDWAYFQQDAKDEYVTLYNH